MSTNGCNPKGDGANGTTASGGQAQDPSQADPAPGTSGVASEVEDDEPASESFDELYPIFLVRKVSEREKALLWSHYRGRWVRWNGVIASFTANGATFRMLHSTSTFDVSVRFEAQAKDRLHAMRVGDRISFIGRLDNYDPLFRTFYLNHGDVGALLNRPDAGTHRSKAPR